MTRAVLFDFGQVLTFRRQPQFFRQLEGELGLPAGELNRVMYRGEAWRQAERGLISEEEWWARIGPSLGLRSDGAVRRFRDCYYRDDLVDPEMARLVLDLHGHWRLAVVSNTASDIRPRLAAAGLSDVWEAVVLSCEAGTAKPEEAIFRTALARVAAAAEEALFIDDSAANVEAARRLGMEGIVFEGVGPLRRELGRLGVV